MINALRFTASILAIAASLFRLTGQDVQSLQPVADEFAATTQAYLAQAEAARCDIEYLCCHAGMAVHVIMGFRRYGEPFVIRMSKRDAEMLETLAQKAGRYGGRWGSKSAVVRALIRREFAAIEREEKSGDERS